MALEPEGARTLSEAGAMPPLPEEIFTPEARRILAEALKTRARGAAPLRICTAEQRLTGTCGPTVLPAPLLAFNATLAAEAMRGTVKEALKVADVRIYDYNTGTPISRNSNLWTSARSEFSEKASYALAVVLEDVKPDALGAEALGKIFKRSEGKAFVRPDKGCSGQLAIGAIGGTLIGIVDEVDLRTKEVTFKLGVFKYQMKYEQIVGYLNDLAK